MNLRNKQLAEKISQSAQLTKLAFATKAAGAESSLGRAIKNLLLTGGSFGAGLYFPTIMEKIKNVLPFFGSPVIQTGPTVSPVEIGASQRPGMLFDVSGLAKRFPQLSNLSQDDLEKRVRQLTFGTLELPAGKATTKHIFRQIASDLHLRPSSDVSYLAGYLSAPAADERKMKIYYSLVALANATVKPQETSAK